MVLVAGLAEKVREASPQDPARHEPVQLGGHKLGQRTPAGFVGPLLLEGEQVFLHDPVQGSLFRLPSRIDRARGYGLYTCRCLHQGGCRSAAHESCAIACLWLSHRAGAHQPIALGPALNPSEDSQTVRRYSTLRRNWPVWLAAILATSSGVPWATREPPPGPPSGPKSMT